MFWGISMAGCSAIRAVYRYIPDMTYKLDRITVVPTRNLAQLPVLRIGQPGALTIHIQPVVLVNAMQLLVEILSEQMVRLPVRFEDVEVPLWAESADDYKSSVVQFRSQVGRRTNRTPAVTALSDNAVYMYESLSSHVVVVMPHSPIPDSCHSFGLGAKRKAK